MGNVLTTPRVYMSPKCLASVLDISTSWIWKLVAKGELPRPHYFGRRVPRWERSEVLAAVRGKPLQSGMEPLARRRKLAE
jgi:predicted DNA-binding transcriptional regulator AlpA